MRSRPTNKAVIKCIVVAVIKLDFMRCPYVIGEDSTQAPFFALGIAAGHSQDRTSDASLTVQYFQPRS
jgi:hypothetical protein